MAQSGFMPNLTRKFDKLKEKVEKLEKEDLDLRTSIAKKLARLDASQNALQKSLHRSAGLQGWRCLDCFGNNPDLN
jgi:chaperonin cofactor prefoldin